MALSVFEQNQLKIARHTLRMSDVGARIMGGMTKDEAREVIARLTGEPILGDELPVPDEYARGDAPMPGDRW